MLYYLGNQHLDEKRLKAKTSIKTVTQERTNACLYGFFNERITYGMRSTR
jgi:hypothetical protein